jgi:WD40-like Beta Propeller Repeat
MNVDGSGQRRLTSGGDREFWPQWSPDGRRLAYMVWDYAACTPVSGSGCAVPDVWTVDADGSGQRKVLDSAFQPRWSPDGSKLLFQRYDSNPDRATLGVYVAMGDGTSVKQLVRAPLWRGRRPGGRSSTESEWALSASTFSTSTAAEHDSSPSARRRRGRTTAAGSPLRAGATSGSSPRAAAGHAESQPRRRSTAFRFRRGRPPESSSRTTPATSCTSPAWTGARRNSSRRAPPVRAEAVAESHRRSGLTTAGACTTRAEITFRRVRERAEAFPRSGTVSCAEPRL